MSLTSGERAILRDYPTSDAAKAIRLVNGLTMSDQSPVQFNQRKTYLAVVKLEADSVEHAGEMIRAGLSAAWAVGSLPTTYDIAGVVADGGNVVQIDFVPREIDDDHDGDHLIPETISL